RAPAILDEVEEAFARIDDDRSRLFCAAVRDTLLAVARIDLGLLEGGYGIGRAVAVVGFASDIDRRRGTARARRSDPNATKHELDETAPEARLVRRRVAARCLVQKLIGCE